MNALALVAALVLASIGVVRGTWAVGGSDSSCYALMADAWAHGARQPVSSLVRDAPWPNAALTVAPAGFFPSPVRPDAASPVCSPGFSMLMVPFRWIGPEGIFFVTPIAAFLLVWFSFVVARTMAGDVAGLVAAVLVATSPIVLFQAVQPMNDVAATAAWMGLLAAASMRRSRAWFMGLSAGLGVLIRPNLLPVAIAAGVWLAIIGTSLDDRNGPVPRSRWLPGLVALTRYGLAVLPGVAAVAWLHWTLYGHPLRSGYGSAADLFSTSFVGTNLSHYARATIETQTVFPILGVLAPLAAPRERRAQVWLAFSLAAITVAVYALYRPFTEWWYLRFLLPAVCIAIVLACATLVWMLEWVRRLPRVSTRFPLHAPAVSVVIALAVTILMATVQVKEAISRQAFDLRRLEARFRDAGITVRNRLPGDAVLITVWQSGAVRYYSGREAVLWDSLDPSSLDPAIEWLQGNGYQPFILVERWEEPLFRERFAAHSTFGNLDWPPRFEIDRLVRIYSPADRPIYLKGDPVPTEYVWPPVDAVRDRNP